MKMNASRKGKKRLGRKLLRLGVVLVLILSAAFWVWQKNLSQVILDMAYANAYSLAVKVINSAVDGIMRSGIAYDDLISVRTNSEGKVTMLQANTVRMNELATKTALEAQEKLQDAKNQVVHVPLGAALGVSFLAGLGPGIPVKILPVGAVSTQFTTEFESAGINQTRHKIILVLKTSVRMVIPARVRQVEIISSVSIAESIIVGDVPETFVDVNDKDKILDLVP